MEWAEIVQYVRTYVTPKHVKPGVVCVLSDALTDPAPANSE